MGHGCDLGIAFDGDGDRIGAVDSSGAVVWADQLLLLMAEDVLRDTAEELIAEAMGGMIGQVDAEAQSR